MTRHGFDWRILAKVWEDGEITQAISLHSKECKERSDKFQIEKLNKEPSDTPVAPENCQFDELVIDKWLHLEQMNDNFWWMRLGDCRIEIHLDDAGKPTVHIQRNEYEPELGRTTRFNERTTEEDPIL